MSRSPMEWFFGKEGARPDGQQRPSGRQGGIAILAYKPHCPPACGGRWMLSNGEAIVGSRMTDGHTGIATWATEAEAQRAADWLNRPAPSGLERIEQITRPLSRLADFGMVALVAQSVPHIPTSWRLPLMAGCIAIVIMRIALRLWLECQTSEDQQGGDDVS